MVTASEAKHLKLEVSNLGPIAEGTVELRPMTVFVGPSNAGKSYLAILIYALHQFFGAYSTGMRRGTDDRRIFPPGLPGLSLAENVELLKGEANAIYDWSNEEWNRLREFVGRSNCTWYESEIPEAVADVVHRALSNFGSLDNDLDIEIARCFGAGKAEYLISYPGHSSSKFSLRNTTSNASGRTGNFRYDITVSPQGIDIDATIPQNMPVSIRQSHLFPRWFEPSQDISNDHLGNVVVTLAAITGGALSCSVGPLGHPAHYLPADRGGVIHTHQSLVRSLIAGSSRPATHDASSQPILSGVHSDFLEGLVGLRSTTAGSADPNLPLPTRLEQNILSGEIRVESNPVGYPAFFYRPIDWQRDLPLMNTSSMVSELAPVVLYLRHIVRSGDTLIIEEPESHLHPQAQVDFTRVLAAAVKAGIRIIITTHSEWVLEELANLVKLSELSPERRNDIDPDDLALSPDDVGAWLFEPNAEKGGSVVREIPLEEETGTFPSGFGLISENLYNRWARITNRIERDKP